MVLLPGSERHMHSFEHQQALDPGRGEPNVGAGLATVGGVIAGATIAVNSRGEPRQ